MTNRTAGHRHIQGRFGEAYEATKQRGDFGNCSQVIRLRRHALQWSDQPLLGEHQFDKRGRIE